VTLTCFNRVLSASKSGVFADSKQEAKLFDALDALGEVYQPHRPYQHSRRGRVCDAFVPVRGLYIECYGGTCPPNDAGSKEYLAVMRAKVGHFAGCPSCGRLLVVFRSAIYGKEFHAHLRKAINARLFDKVNFLGDESNVFSYYYARMTENVTIFQGS